MPVETARGPIDADALGTTLMHEHLFLLDPELERNYPGRVEDDDTLVADAVRRLREAKQHGVDTLVDLTVLGQGRHVARVARVAEQVDVNIVVATGLYTYADLPMVFHFRGPGAPMGGVEPMVELFLRDVTEGIAGTGIKAAILKCATDEPGVTPGVERVLRACAQVHVATGVPISTHTHARSRRGLDQIRIFREEGVDLSRVVIGHSGDTDDLDYLEELVAAGCSLGMDRFGIVYPTFEMRVQTVVAMCERGYADRMVLSHDAMCACDWFEPTIYDMQPKWHFTHVCDDVVPELLRRGVTEDQVRQMLVDNPARLLTRAGSRPSS